MAAGVNAKRSGGRTSRCAAELIYWTIAQTISTPEASRVDRSRKFIAGNWRESRTGETLPVIAPATAHG
jgi:hypothetical protein